MSDRENKTKIGWCGFCDQGWLEIWKTGKTGKLNIVCSECETQYDSPRDALRETNPRLYSVEIDGFGIVPTAEELAVTGWDWYIIGIPCFEVDFNERFVNSDGSGVVLLSQTDERSDKDGNRHLLYEGMSINIFEPDEEDGQPDNLLAQGVVTKCTIEHMSHVKWCCKMNGNGIRHESDICD
jgi:hypothetical protein